MSRFQGPIMQVGYVVDDLDAAIRHWAGTLGVGPFVVAESIPYETVSFRGRPLDLETRVAIAYSGALQIELIQQISPQPSVFTEFRTRHGTGMHHVCALTSDFDADIAAWKARGVEVVQGGRTRAGIDFAYLDTDGGFGGAMLEIVTATPGLMRFFDRLRNAAEAWDGEDPIYG